MQIGFIGLGKMGKRMVGKLIKDNHSLVVWNRSQAPVENFKLEILNLKSNQNVQIAKSIRDLVQSLKKPRVIWIMVSAGEATQQIIDELVRFLEPEDIIIDGGNANFKDTEKRYETLKTKKIKFLGVGVSGGIIAAETGYPLMVGGDKSAYSSIVQLLDTLAWPDGGHTYFGTGGAGHFVKMVHNGIEYGYMQALGEGFGVLEKSEYKFNLLDIAKLYQKGTLLSGFMMDRTTESLELDPSLSTIVGILTESGEAKWTIAEAEKMGVPVDVIEKSLDFRKRSQTDEKIQQSFAAKLVAVLRNAFGGHEVTKK